MKQYERFMDYVLFEQIESDFIGDNYRVGKTIDRKVKGHAVVSRIHPYFLEDSNTWNRIKILLEGVKKSNIPHLHSPTNIDQESKTPHLEYPLIKAKSFEQVIQDANEKEIPINFDLAMSIAISIAELVDMGSSIVVSGQRSFHGFLTPDNILIDSDGKIFLKNYGIAAYLSYADNIYEALSKKYGTLLTPEFLKRDKITAQSDIYHLGFLVYKMLTGHYFSYTEGEDFESKFANISFSSYVPTTDKDFLTGIITFFKKTLNPDPSLRFSNIKEFKDFISRYFHIEELSSVTFNLAYFISSVYDETDEALNKQLAQELIYEIPEEKKPEPARTVDSSHLVEDILTGLDNKEKSSKGLWIGIVGAAVVILAVIIIMVMQSKSAAEALRKQQLQQQQIYTKQMEMMRAEQDENQKKIEALMQQTSQSEEERRQRDEQVTELRKKQEEIEKRRKEEADKLALTQKTDEEGRQRLLEEEAEKQRQIEVQKAKDFEEQRLRDEAARQEEERRNRIPQFGELIELSEVDIQPKRTAGEIPQKFSSDVRKALKGQTIKATVRLLIDEKGQITKTEVLPRELDPMLRLEISQIMIAWKFEPARKKNVAVKVWFQQSFDLSF